MEGAWREKLDVAAWLRGNTLHNIEDGETFRNKVWRLRFPQLSRWTDGFGVQCVEQWDNDHSRGAILSLGPGAELEIFAAAREAEPLKPPNDGFQIMIHSDNPRSDFARLQSKGVSIETPPMEKPWATQFTLRDPNGVQVFLYRSKNT